MSDPSSIRADFIQHLKSTNKEGSGKASSYVRALDILDELINEGKIQAPSSVWSLRAPADLKKLDTFVAEQQKTQNGVFKDTPRSYWESGFYSAALRHLKDFHQAHSETKIRVPVSSFQHSRSLVPKPFLILAGISGTGKTRWVRRIAERTGGGESNLCLIPVRPDWHEPSDLLGYTSRISSAPKFVATPFLAFLVEAWKNAWAIEKTLATPANAVAQLTPHWVCLDEMNLAPVEQYFADYLSVVESRSWDAGTYACDALFSFESRQEDELESIRSALLGANPDADAKELWGKFCSAAKPGIPLPPNLVVVGTVNMDETTHAFSRKVLDRAFTVEFDPHGIAKSYREDRSVDPVLGIELADGATIPASAVLSTSTTGKDVPDSIQKKVDELIDSWNDAMAETPFRVAYRTLNESLLYAASKGEEKIAEALDGILMMKLLPRLEGDSDKLGYDGEALATDEAFDKLGEAKNTLIHAAWQKAKIAIGVKEWPDSKSKKKLHYMAKRLARTGYTSFWP